MQESGDGVTAFFEDGSNATGGILSFRSYETWKWN